jgi:hypothetical protein
MAIFDVKLCGGETLYEVDINGGIVGEFWYFINPTVGREQDLCGEILNESSAGSAVYTGITPYNNCYDCLSTLDEALYVFTLCNTEDTFAYITPSDFGSLPALGDVFYLTIENRGVISSECVFFSEIQYDSPEVPNTFISQTPYSECNQCLSITTPRSGGTDYFTCVICCDCGSTASTINQVVNPHPVWTDGYGTEVTQLGMVTIGGNGLNS